MPLITLIVPIYNVERYLHECLQSVENQSLFNKLQVVLVNDGSTDSSGTIASEFAAKHQNVELINQENRGLGGARNRGMSVARAPYLAFLDSDDILPRRALEHLLEATVKHGSDVGVGIMETFPKPKSHITHKVVKELSGSNAKLVDAPDLIHSASACNKIFRREFIENLQLHFGEGVHFEDVYFTLPALFKAVSIAFTDDTVYLYRRGQGSSIMGNVFNRPENYLEHLTANEFLTDYLGPNISTQEQEILHSFCIRSIQGFSVRATEVLNAKMLKEFYERGATLYRGYSNETIDEWTDGKTYRYALVCLAENNFEALKLGSAMLDIASVESGKVVFRSSSKDAKKWSDSILTKAGSRIFGAYLDGFQLDPTGKNVNVRGRIQFPEHGFTKVPNFNAYAQIAGLKIPLAFTPRYFSDRVPASTWLDFDATVPVHTLSTSNDKASLVLEGKDGSSLTQELKSSAGLVRRFRAFKVGNRRFSVVAQRKLVNFKPVSTIWGPRFWRESLTAKGFGWNSIPLYLLFTATRRLMQNKNYWLIGERTDTARENGMFLYNSLRAEGRKNVYYVIKANSPDQVHLNDKSGIVKLGSLKHTLIAMHAELIMSSHDVFSYVIPPVLKTEFAVKQIFRRGKSRWGFLQHGVTHNDVLSALAYQVAGFDFLVAAAKDEAEFLASRGGLRDTVLLTGFPRFDRKPIANFSQKPYILFMPTWRRNLGTPSYAAGRVTFEKHGVAEARAEFVKAITDVIGDKKLSKSLEKRGVELRVIAHYELEHMGVLNNIKLPKNIHIISSGKTDIGDEIRNCAALVTDWSSVAFDAAYFEKPVAYYQFDEEAFRADHYHPGYYEFEKDGFGPVARTAGEIAKEMKKLADDNFVIPAVYRKRALEFFGKPSAQNTKTLIKRLDKLTNRA